jgi:hypothetical protein
MIQAWVFFQISLNSYQHLNPWFFIFFFLKKRGVYLKFWYNLTENFNGELKLKKLKDGYLKLTLLKFEYLITKVKKVSGYNL